MERTAVSKMSMNSRQYALSASWSAGVHSNWYCDSAVLQCRFSTYSVRTGAVSTLRGLAVHIVSSHSPSGVQRFRYLVSSPFNIEHVPLNVLCSHIPPLIYIS